MTIPAGLILCGGASRRMGRDKATLPIGEEVMLQRVVRLVGREVDRVLVVAAEGQALPALPGSVVVVRDAVAGEGPLRALATGLRALPEATDLVFATATDQPLLQPGWIARLAGLIGTGECVVPDCDGRLHPLAALYRRDAALRAAEALLAADHRRLLALFEALDGRTATATDLLGVDPALATLRNANTPEDYRRLLAEHQRRPTDRTMLLENPERR